MKRTLLWIAALCFACFGLQSCNDDPENGGNGGNGGNGSSQEDPGGGGGGGTDVNPTGVDYAAIDFMQYVWLLSSVDCDEIPAAAKAELEAAINRNNGSAIIDIFGVSGAAEYKGWGLNMSVNVQSKFAFFVESYKVVNGKHQLSAKTPSGKIYSGEIKYNCDGTYVNAMWRGTSSDGKTAAFSGYQRESVFPHKN